ncbi:MAG: hypothetical protein K6A44_07195 [bacterium]|nr:hypothetical protein [bacterium]
MTIPSLMQTYKERQTVTHLKKFYSTISNAVKRAEADENPIGNWEYCSGEGVNSDKFLAQLIKYLQVSKVCWNDDNTCSTDEAYITLDQSRTWNAGNPNWGGYSRAILSDGSLMFVCPSCGEDDDRYGEVNIDINGEKGPNRLGVDTFHFYILKDGAKVTPSYHGENLEESCNLNYYGNGDNGDGCAMWIIKKGNMNYLHKTVSWDD